ncbi:MAG: butyrate kinase [Bacteroidetes bacterium 4572_112]|nr:MAG: butyrate kinase [Bacteroidetes bacterium 4572_112]
MQELILAINPGSTSTKIAVYRRSSRIFIKTISHSSAELKPFKDISSQFEFRMQIILDEVRNAHINIDDIVIVMGRGGLVKPIPSGVYEVNQALIEDLKVGVMGQHASNLGGLIAHEIAQKLPSAKAYIVDPVVVDEFEELARLSGHPNFERKSIFHALNQKAIARNHAKTHHLEYDELNLIVAHMGGGISVGAHKKGKVIDVNQALDGDGPYSPERSGSLPIGAVVETCFSGEYSKEEIKKMIVGKGGYMAYLDTNDAYAVETASKNGDKKAELIEEGMAYQVAKEIGAMATVLEGNVNAILLTGGIAYGKPFIDMLNKRIQHIARIFVYPGEDEMKALAMNGLRVIKNETEVLEYK